MAEWGKYLKNAVANVEQQLDKVLLENQTKTQSPRASISPASSTSRRSARPDLQERLKRATNASRGDRKGGSAGEGEAIRRSSESIRSHASQSSVPLSTESNGTAAMADPAAGPAAAPADEPDASSPSNAEPTAAGQDPETTEVEDTPELITTQELVVAPDMGHLLNQARKVALAYQNDSTLELVDVIEAFQAEYERYDDNVTQRLKSMNSKIAFLSAQRAAESSGSEQRVALLLDEGQRLSQQELKLGLIIKKLRAERAAILSKETTVESKEKESAKETAKLRAEKTALMNQLQEQEALVEHFRGLAESASVSGLNSPDPSTAGNAPADVAGGARYHDLVQRLKSTESNLEVAKRTWHDLESSLLTRITELELNAEARATSAAQLQHSFKEAQETTRETRNQLISLQDELDASQEKWLAKEKQYHHDIEELKGQLSAKSTELTQLREQAERDAASRASAHPVNEATEFSPNQKDTRSSEENPLAVPNVVIDTKSVQDAEFGDQDSLEPMETFNDEEFGRSAEFLNELNNPVGPTGPFGSLATDFDSEHRPNLSRDDSRDMFEDSLSFMAPSASRRESSIVGSEAVSGSQLHIVKKLTLTVRKLENELSSMRKACELAERQREEAQSEVVRLVDAEDNLAALKRKYDELVAANDKLTEQVSRLETVGIDKSERIEELEADVRDLKEMYREQVEALITEIEGLKSAR